MRGMHDNDEERRGRFVSGEYLTLRYQKEWGMMIVQIDSVVLNEGNLDR